MKRRIRGASISWRLKQLLPLSYSTISRPMIGEPRRFKVGLTLNVDAEDRAHAYRIAHEISKDYCGVIHEPVDVSEQAPQFVRWRMWFGRAFNVVRTPI